MVRGEHISKPIVHDAICIDVISLKRYAIYIIVEPKAITMPPTSAAPHGRERPHFARRHLLAGAGAAACLAVAPALALPAATVLPIDPAADAELFRLFAQWQALNRSLDANADNAACMAVATQIYEVEVAMCAAPAVTRPGLALKLRLAWMRRTESREHEIGAIYDTEVPPLPWDDEGRWARPEFDPEWSFIRDVARLLGVAVAEEGAS